MKFRFFLSVITLVTLQIAYGQEMPKVIPPSPTATQFHRFGDYPVSHFTGVPEISIPIYTIQEGDIEMPISISYHASGSRPNEPRGLLGQGWVLNVGGQVSREIRDKPDEYYPFSIPSVTAENIPYWDQGYRYNDLYMREKYNDLEHDVYSYNCNGQSGKFIIKASGEPMLIPYNNMKVIHGPMTGNFYGIAGMSMVDEKGIVYSFGDGTNTTEYGEWVDQIANGFMRYPTTTWHLKTLSSSANPNHGISIEYVSSNSINQWLTSDLWTYDDAWEESGCMNTEYACGCLLAEDVLEYSTWNYGLSPMGPSNLVHYQTVSPSRINFSSGHILFTYDATTKVLTKISIYNAKDELISVLAFSVVPVTPTAPNLIGTFTRFKLASIDFMDAQENKLNNYKFNYYRENEADLVSSEYTNSYDYWGFNNRFGALTTPGFPRYAYQTRERGAPYDRYFGTVLKSANEDYAESNALMERVKAYTLEKITYPTGGYTKFSYELNKEENKHVPYFVGKWGGGLRVTAIENYIGDKKVSAKEYIYDRGIMGFIPHPSYYMTSKNATIYRGGNAVPSWYRQNYFSMNPMVNFSPFGSSIIYPEVREISIADNPSNNTVTTYTYDYDPNSMEQKPMDYPNALNSFYGSTMPPKLKYFATNNKPWLFGNLLSKVITGADGRSVTEGYEYEEVIKGSERDFLLEPFAIPTSPYYQSCFVPGTGNPTTFFNSFYTYYSYDCYYNFADRYYISGYKRLKSKSTSYLTNTSAYVGIGTTENYYYDNLNYELPTHSISTNSKGEEIKTVFKRPYDFMSTNVSNPNIYNQMVEKNILSPIVEQYSYKNNNLLDAVRTNYNQWAYGAWGGSLVQNNIIAPQTVETKRGAGAWEARLRYDALDEKGNVKTVYKEGDIKHSFLWGYGKLYPVAEITGADHATASALINQGTLDNLSTTDAQMRTELDKVRTGLLSSKVLVNSYTYKPLVGMTSQTDHTGRSAYFEYDAAGRLEHIKDQNSSILKKYAYNYFDGTTASATAAQWQNTSNGYCETCKTNASFLTGIYKQQQRDNNPLSPSYNQTRWIDLSGYYAPSCVSSSPDWVPTGNLRCVTISGQNTGEQEREELYVNPCRNPYGSSANWMNNGQIKRWTNIGQNPSACPKPAYYLCDDLSGLYRKSDCGQDYLGSEVYVPISAGQFTSPTSVAEANALALAYAYSQANQDPNATCTPIPFTLYFSNTSGVLYDIELLDPATNNPTYTFVGPSFTNVGHFLGNILPGTYHVRLSPRYTSYQQVTFGAGCTYTATGISETIYNVPLSTSCSNISID